jgi:hypothetical protein
MTSTPALDLGAFGITVPASWTAMWDAGLLRYGTSREDWKQNRRTIMRDAPPALMTRDLEWLPPADIVKTAELNHGRTPWRPGWAELPFVSFAVTGAGDGWGWAPSLAPGAAEAPIVFVEHDSDDARIVAPTFEAFVFREALEALVHVRRTPKEPLKETLALVRATTRRTASFLPPRLAKALERALDLPLRKIVTRRVREEGGRIFSRPEDVHYQFVFESHARDIVRRALDYPRLDERLPPKMPA